MELVKEQLLWIISTPIYIIIIGGELLLSHFQHKKAYTLKDTAANVYLMILNSVVDLSFRIIYIAILAWIFQFAVIQWERGFMYWFILLIAEDFLYYWLHRFDHEVRFFWATHVTHHSSEHLNFSVGFRSSVFQPLYRFIYFLPLAWFGFNAADIVFMYSATQIWGIFVHTEFIKKMGPLEYIFVTPSHHRVHHANNPKYLDKNMGMFLIFWDKLFGTFQPELPEEEYQPIIYGLTKNIENKNAVNIVFHEWKQMAKDVRIKGLSWKQRWNYVFGPPGWSHDGNRKTSVMMREEENGKFSVEENKDEVKEREAAIV
ncbi:MAG: sterol desaturase family protein [Chitinophagaceae bacterium]